MTLELEYIFRRYFAPHCPPGTTPEQIAERLRTYNHLQDYAAWKAAYDYYAAHPAYGIYNFARQFGVREGWFRQGIEYMKKKAAQ